jgi:F-type H+-transporting ATPase subunit epsilon
MTSTIHVDVVSSEAELFSGEAEFVVAPGESGELGIYPRHTPLLTRLKPGSVRLRVAGRNEEELIYVSGGMLEVQPDRITILSDTAIRGQDLDESRALEAMRAAEEALTNRTSKIEYAEAQRELAQAVAQIATIRKLRKGN